MKILKILIVGGSQGASFFNKKITNMVLELSKEKKLKLFSKLIILMKKSKIEELYKKSNIIFELFNFDESLHTKIKISTLQSLDRVHQQLLNWLN